VQEDPQATIAGGAEAFEEAESSGAKAPDARVVRARGLGAAEDRRGRPRATGAAANASVVGDAAGGESAPVVVTTAPRGTRGAARKRSHTARATKGTGVVAGAPEARTAVDEPTQTSSGSITPPGDSATAAEAVASGSAGAPPAATPASPVAPPDVALAVESAPSGIEPATLVGEQASQQKTGDPDVDTGPMPAHSSPVDENTGSRQRITLFGRRRRAAAASAAAEAADSQTAAEESDLLAELVRETETDVAIETEAPTIAAPGPTRTGRSDVPDWVVEQVYASDERDEALASPASDEYLVETVDRNAFAGAGAATASAEAESESAHRARARRAAETRAFPPARPAPPSTAPVVLAVNGLHKRYGDVVAVDGVNLSVRAGSLYGIVGPNGAGKTTTLSIITGLLRADSGSVSVNGVDARKHPRDAKRVIGVLPDHLRTFDRLTGAQLLYYAGTLRGLDAATTRQRSSDLATAFGIEDAMGRLVADYSAGMTKKVSLAAAMIHSPRLLVLDEPFEGVDPVSAATVTGILKRYVDAGGTVLLSSHGMDLVQRICDSVAIIVGGVVLDSGPVDDVRGEKTLEDRFIELAGGRKAVEGLEWLHSFSD
jgi:ABC-2 type transport system ATP-binding protein